jgi:hypothetical protein
VGSHFDEFKVVGLPDLQPLTGLARGRQGIGAPISPGFHPASRASDSGEAGPAFQAAAAKKEAAQKSGLST